MKALTVLTVLLSFFNFAQGMTHTQDHPSVHGMLMVGKSKIYLSHLPMFHSPHDYQVIIEAELSSQGKEAYLASQATSNETVYTLVPEVFVLPEMIQNPKPFSAQVFKGHFERGGTLIADNVTVSIKKVLYFKKFSPSEVKPSFGTYILFGNKSEQFLAHSITAKPDFDQILKVSFPHGISSLPTGENVASVVFKSLSNSTPIEKSGMMDAEIVGPTKTVPVAIEIDQSLYLEHGDLSH